MPKQRIDSFQQDPTRICIDALFLQSGGDIRHNSIKRIREATIDAFMEAANKEGLTATWSLEMKAKTPADFDKMLAHRGLKLQEPDPK